MLNFKMELKCLIKVLKANLKAKYLLNKLKLYSQQYDMTYKYAIFYFYQKINLLKKDKRYLL